jgi:peptidoglycan/xylan/chitin deacetylase (PgdA/CDA1 family)
MVPVFVHHIPDEGSRSSRSTAFVIADLKNTRQALREHIGRDPRWLAWPFGWANTELDSLAREAGFRGTLSLSEGTNAAGRDDTWHLSRITVTARTTLRSFVELMESVEADAPLTDAQARNAP